MLRRSALNLHEADRLTCDECNYKFELQSSLRRHKCVGHKGGNYAYDRWGYSTTREAKLVVLRQSKHEALKHSCDKCEPWFLFLEFS